MMMNKLYPFKFLPIYREKVWGGQRIKTVLGKDFSPLPNCGETWEISGMEGFVSDVGNGFLRNNSLNELVEIYMGDLLGDQVYDRFGNTFPLLIKFVDTDEALSVQVHPGDEMAYRKHRSPGKTEMWYVVHADPGAEIIVGFKPGVGKQDYLRHLDHGTLPEILHAEQVKAGDVLFMPAGRIHAIGAGIMVCEIQQASDITYRVYDWDRPGMDGKPRDLHIEEALEAIDFSPVSSYLTKYHPVMNGSVGLVSCPYFTTNLLLFDRTLEHDYYHVDSFVAYICIEGSFSMEYSGGSERVVMGDAIVLPAEINSLKMVPDRGAVCRVLEIYIV